MGAAHGGYLITPEGLERHHRAQEPGPYTHFLDSPCRVQREHRNAVLADVFPPGQLVTVSVTNASHSRIYSKCPPTRLALHRIASHAYRDNVHIQCMCTLPRCGFSRADCYASIRFRGVELDLPPCHHQVHCTALWLLSLVL